LGRCGVRVGMASNSIITAARLWPSVTDRRGGKETARKTVRVIILMAKSAPYTSHPIVRSLGDMEPFDLLLTYLNAR